MNIDEALQNLKEFSTRNDPKELRKDLWFMTEATLCSDHPDLIEATTRANLLNTYAELNKIVDALSLLFPLDQESLVSISQTKSTHI